MALSEIVRHNLANLKAPAMIFPSSVDHVVPPENSGSSMNPFCLVVHRYDDIITYSKCHFYVEK